MRVTNNGSFPWRGTPLGDALERLRPAGGSGDGGAAGREGRARVARQAVAAQAEAGCDLVTDGLARRDETLAELVTRLDGVEPGAEPGGAAAGRGRVPVVRREIAWKEPL